MQGRAALATIDEHTDGEVTRVRVTLAWNDQAFAGEAGGPAGQEARPRLVGEATLRAAEQLLEGHLGFDLMATATTDLGTARVAMAQIGVKGSSEPLVGSALIRQNDPGSATAKAVLDAINRMLAKANGG